MGFKTNFSGVHYQANGVNSGSGCAIMTDRKHCHNY